MFSAGGCPLYRFPGFLGKPVHVGKSDREKTGFAQEVSQESE